MASVAAIAVVIGLWRYGFPAGLGLRGPVIYRTGVGGIEDVHLSDGSSITLGGRTKLSVAFSSQYRSVTLFEGEAWFKVAHEQHWPFVVAAGGGKITDVGTAFVVSREFDRVIVTVTDGTVEVATERPRPSSPTINRNATPAPVMSPIRVTEGEELAYSDKGSVSAVRAADARAATAWTHGRLTFNGEPLRDVIAAVERYSPRRIAVSPKAGALRFSGIVFDNEIDEWLQGLEQIFPVTVEQRGAAVWIDVRHSTPLRRQSEPSLTTRP